MKRLKTMTCLGTRPEIIRLSRVLARLDRDTDHVLVHTGQNWDHELNQVFFDELGVRKPDRFLGVDTSSLAAVLAGVLLGVEQAILEERPDAFLVLGDTNSCIGAYMAKRHHVPVFHMEAGNRCFDQNVPEETNRKVIDHLADFNLAYTEHARRNLLAEGLPARRVLVTGSPMAEVLAHHRAGIDASTVLDDEGLTPGGFFLVSVHREENVDAPENLARVVALLERLAAAHGMPVVVSTHPRTRKRIEAAGLQVSGDVRFHKPFGFLDYNRLQLGARCVLSDSGTISEESAMLGFPAVTVRNALERPEALDTGAIVLTGLEPDDVLRAVDAVVAQAEAGERPEVPADYRVMNFSQRVVNLVLGTAPLHRRWAGIEMSPREA